MHIGDATLGLFHFVSEPQLPSFDSLRLEGNATLSAMEKIHQQHREADSVSVLNCIDLSSTNIQNSVSSLKQACLDCGFFYVVNHGISREFMAEVFHQSRKFFELPGNEKMKVLRNEKHRGYTPELDELLDPQNQVHGDYKEGYYIGVEVPEDDPEADKPFYGPNVWPSSDLLPDWRETMEKFHQQALDVARAVARIIALALDLEADFFDKPEMLGQPIAVMRLLHYGGQVSDPSKGLYGAGAHSDYGLITLLATDDICGLQICKDKDAQPQVWEYVAPMQGKDKVKNAIQSVEDTDVFSLPLFNRAFVVNLGDMLERWSNCIFKSTLHRVLGNGQERYSIAYFVEPSHDCLVECLPTCKSEENPPKFPPIKCSTYLSQRYKDTHANLNVYNQKQNT
ncbi:2-oxoglutarate-Fe(II) type oxidoreductase hxnY [Linum grandiflorum]